MINVRTLIRIHFCIALLALAYACCDGMYRQEDFMTDQGILGIGIAFATMLWTPTLLPNRALKFEVPPFGILAFGILILYSILLIFIVDNGERSSMKIIRTLMHILFLLTLIGSYRWYSFNSIRKTDTYIFVGMLSMLLLTYIAIFQYMIENLIVMHLATSYYLLYMLPIALLVKPWKWKSLCIIATFIVVLSSMKRGGTLALVFGLIIYAFTYLHCRSINIIKSFTIFVISVLIIGGVVFFVGSADNETEDKNLIERFEDIQKDGGSNRDHVYSITLNLITSQELSGLLVGNGYNAVIKDSPIHFSAHNDFMEIMYDYGVIGFLCFLVFTLSFLRVTIKAFRQKAHVAPMLCFQFTNFIILSNISHIFIYMFMPLIILTYGIGKGQMRYEKLINSSPLKEE